MKLAYVLPVITQMIPAPPGEVIVTKNSTGELIIIPIQETLAYLQANASRKLNGMPVVFPEANNQENFFLVIIVTKLQNIIVQQKTATTDWKTVHESLVIIQPTMMGIFFPVQEHTLIKAELERQGSAAVLKVDYLFDPSSR